MLVEVDGSAEAHQALVWSLREAARRDATVVAVSVLDDPDGDPLTGLTRVPRRTREAARDHLEALDAAMHGADLVMVGAGGKRLLRPVLPRQPLRRVARGA